jgi:hypothetical protein
MKKTCFKCGKIKSLDEFYTHAVMADGRLNKCKECTRADVKRRRRDDPSVQEYDRKRAKTPERKAYARAVVIAWRAKHPDAYQAQTAVGNALRDGKLVKGSSCVICGASDHVQGHHKDYGKPLDVTWLCSRCLHRYHQAK